MGEIVDAGIQLSDAINTLEENNGHCDRVQQAHVHATFAGEVALTRLDKVDTEIVTGIINDVETGYEANGALIITLKESIDTVRTASSGVRSVNEYFSSAKLYGDKLRRPFAKASIAMGTWRVSAEENLRPVSDAAQSAELAKRQLQGYGSGNDLFAGITGELVQGVIDKAQNYRDEVAPMVAATVREDDIKLTGAIQEFWTNLGRVGRETSGFHSIENRMKHAQQLLESCLADLEAMNDPEVISGRLGRLLVSQQEIIAVKASAADTLAFLQDKTESPGEIAGLSQAAKSAAEQARENL